MTASRYDVIMIGGGVVGLGVALEITRRFPRQKLLLVEKEDKVARHQSGHNSGVIHSGVYYGHQPRSGLSEHSTVRNA